MLLTDGQPNIVPPRGHLPMLQRYQEKNSALEFSINTFGFGYNLDSKLLTDLAVEGAGTYSFIPDSGFVGTCFVHATRSLLYSLHHSLYFSLSRHYATTANAPTLSYTVLQNYYHTTTTAICLST